MEAHGFLSISELIKFQIYKFTFKQEIQLFSLPQDNQDFPEQSLKYTSTQISIIDLFFSFHHHNFTGQSTDRRRLPQLEANYILVKTPVALCER